MFQALRNCLAERGVSTFLQTPRQLVVSSSLPNLPTSNSFWVACHEGAWYLSTWLPAIYRIPPDQDVCEVCSGVLASSDRAVYTVAKEYVRKYELTRLSGKQTDALLMSLFRKPRKERRKGAKPRLNRS